MGNVIDTIRQIELFKGFSEAELGQIAAVAEELNFAEGTIIFRENTPAEFLYLIGKGTVALEMCAPSVGCRRILSLSNGELLGWSPVLEHAKFTATARAMTDVCTIRIKGRDMLTLCESDLRFGYQFMKRTALALAQRLNATRLQLVNIFGPEMPSTVLTDTDRT